MKKKEMQLEPKDLYEKLEFDKILELLDKYCLGDLGRQQIQNLSIETEKLLIERKLRQVNEYKLSLTEGDQFPIRKYEDISKELRMLEVVDYVLPEEGLQKINVILRFFQGINKFFNEPRREMYPTLFDVIKEVSFDANLIKAIEKVIDEEGNIKPDASPALAKIRRGIINKQREMEKTFRHLIAQYRSKGWLTDSVESFRNGRRVLSAPSEHKRKIRGIIHDESTTGRTAFIEPEEVISINNDIFDFQTEEKREIYRILKELSGTLRPFVPLIKRYQSVIVRYDVIQAKGVLANSINGIMPKVMSKPHLGIQMGKHPLLYLKNKKLGKETVPFDLELFGQNRVVVVSGPNAGGKSILMKSVGLLQLMFQAGMLVPADEISKFGVFKKIFADIGDQQSLEDDLSTYSSRLANAKTFLENSDKETLILIDEFGSGTDPKIGGAIAESVLHKLNQTRFFGVVTTHYTNLKLYAFKTKGIVNGSMLFDQNNLSPTYQFKVGRPGSSYAFEIAKKVGLDENVLEYAKKRTGKNEKAVDQLLVDLQREKQELVEKLDDANDRAKKLERLMKNYEELQKDLEFRRKKFKLEAKEKALQDTARENKALEKVIREIRENQNLEAAKKAAIEARQKREQLSSQVINLNEDIYEKPAKSYKQPTLKVGDFVRMRSGGSTGKLVSLNKKKAMVTMGILTMEVKVRDLIPANQPLEQKPKSIYTDTIEKNAEFESRIDIRGMKAEEALKVIEEFVDQGLVNNVAMLQIVHGKGTGALRNLVRTKLREYSDIRSIKHPEAKFGGDGVTYVEL